VLKGQRREQKAQPMVNIMIPTNPFIVNSGFDSPSKIVCRYRTGGHLVYPLSLLKSVGSLTQAYSSAWAMSTAPRPKYTPAVLAKNGCVPVRTMKRYFSRLSEHQISLCPDDNRRWWKKTFLGGDYIQIPRAWFFEYPDATFTELLLRGWFGYKCRENKTGLPVPYRVSNSRLVELMGFNRNVWGRAGKALENRGCIVRRLLQRGYEVSIP